MMAGKGLPQDCGLLVVGHGTADRVGEAETRTLVGHISDACPGGAVELGFLEVIGPSVGESLRRLCARGVDRVVAAPLLLFTNGHARRDLPEALAAAVAEERIPVVQAAALGHHPELVRLSRRRREETRRVLPPLDPREEALEEIVDPSRPGLVPRRVLVQPHLLFRGRVEEQVREAVDRARSRHPAIEWIVVPRLGAEPDVARAVVARALETLEKVEG